MDMVAGNRFCTKQEEEEIWPLVSSKPSLPHSPCITHNHAHRAWVGGDAIAAPGMLNCPKKTKASRICTPALSPSNLASGLLALCRVSVNPDRRPPSTKLGSCMTLDNKNGNGSGTVFPFADRRSPEMLSNRKRLRSSSGITTQLKSALSNPDLHSPHWINPPMSSPFMCMPGFTNPFILNPPQRAAEYSSVPNAPPLMSAKLFVGGRHIRSAGETMERRDNLQYCQCKENVNNAESPAFGSTVHSEDAGNGRNKARLQESSRRTIVPRFYSSTSNSAALIDQTPAQDKRWTKKNARKCSLRLLPFARAKASQKFDDRGAMERCHASKLIEKRYEDEEKKKRDVCDAIAWLNINGRRVEGKELRGGSEDTAFFDGRESSSSSAAVPEEFFYESDSSSDLFDLRSLSAAIPVYKR